MRRRLLLFVVAGLVLAVPLALALRDWVRDVFLVELWRAYQAVRIFVEGLSQMLLWGLLLVVFLILAVSSLIRRRRALPRRAGGQVVYQGQVQALTLRIQRASRGSYFRWRLARYLGDLTCEVMALQERATAAQLRRRLRAGNLDLPGVVNDYFQSTLSPLSERPAGLLSRIRAGLEGGTDPPGREPAVESLVDFLEEQLRIIPRPHGRPGEQAELQQVVGGRPKEQRATDHGLGKSR